MRHAFASLGLLCALVARERTSHGQACCAGGAAYSPGRLQWFEDAAVGAGFRLVRPFGSFDTAGRYLGQPTDNSELDLEQDFVGTLRLLGRGQVSVLVPMVETLRTAPGISDSGGGVGDVTLASRYDFTVAGEVRRLPGLGLLLGVIFPSGTPVESSASPLGSGATGTGAWQLSGGLSLEQTYGPIFLGLVSAFTFASARTVGQVHEQVGLRIAVTGAGGYVFANGAALVGTVAIADSTDVTINGETQPGTGQRQLTGGVSAGLPIAPRWRLQGSLFSDLPVGGQNHAAGFGTTGMLLRTWM